MCIETFTGGGLAVSAGTPARGGRSPGGLESAHPEQPGTKSKEAGCAGGRVWSRADHNARSCAVLGWLCKASSGLQPCTGMGALAPLLRFCWCPLHAVLQILVRR